MAKRNRESVSRAAREAVKGREAEAAAGAAVAGAIAAGRILVSDRRAKGRKQKQRRDSRLHEGEFVPDGVRRVAHGRMDAAIEDLAGAGKRDFAEAVHDARKALSRGAAQ